MKCDKDEGIITDYVSGQLNAAKKTEFEQHLLTCAGCRQEVEVQQQLWAQLGTLAVPPFSSKLDELDPYVVAIPQPSGMWLKIAAVFILVMAGFGAGYLVNRSAATISYKQQVDSLSAAVHDMREMMMLSLLENPSASERLRAVSYTSEIRSVNGKMIEALLSTLNNDPNVNVRLMTLDALTHYIAIPAVREGLVQSIIQQDSPLVQSAMADVMEKIQEKKAVTPFKKLLQQKQINLQVRNKIEQTISRLI